MDIHSEAPNSNSSVPAVDAAVPTTGTTPEAAAVATTDPSTQSTTLTQDMEAAGEHPAVLTGLEPVGTPQTPEIIATHNAMVDEKKDAQNQPPQQSRLRRFFGQMGFGGGNSAPAAPVATAPDHLTPTGNGTLQTPEVANLNGATADGASAPKFDAPAATQPAENNYAGLSTPDATTVGQATGVPFQNSIPSPENGGLAAAPTEVSAPAEVVASAAPILGSSQPEVAPDPVVAAPAAEPVAAVEEPAAEPIAEVSSQDQPAEFVPSAEAVPAQVSSTLPDATVVEPAAEPVVDAPLAAEPAAEPAEETVQQPAQAGPGVVGDGTVAPPDWSVDASAAHPDAPVVGGDSTVASGDALGQALADGAAAAAERPPFSSDALNNNMSATASTEVGHDIPIETGSEPDTTGEVADTAAAATIDTDTDPTAPVVAAPGGMSPTAPGVVDGTSALDAGLPPSAASTTETNYAGLSTPDATAAGVATGVPFQNSIPSPENGGIAAAPVEPVADPLASGSETSSNITAFTAGQSPLGDTPTDQQQAA